MLNEFNFLFNNENIHIEFDSNGVAWFRAYEIARLLGYTRERNMYRILTENEKGAHIVSTPGGPQEIIFINEFGLYRLTFTSRRPEAVELQNKVFYDILPCIRKYGAYIDPNTRAQLDANPNLIHTLNANIDNHEKKRMYHLIYPDSTEYRLREENKKLIADNSNMSGMINYLENEIDRINKFNAFDPNNYDDSIDYSEF